MLLVFLFLLLLTLFFQPCHCKSVLVDGVSEWKTHSVHVGDSIFFNHKHHYKLFIFKNKGAFAACNLTQATLLNKPNSTSFMWNPSRVGVFYFSFNNGSSKPCEEGQKLAIEVSLSAPFKNWAQQSPDISPVAGPEPVPGGAAVVSSTPAYPWPFRPREKAAASPSVSPRSMNANSDPYDGVPFINSNPAVPLPTGEVDSATIRPQPTSGSGEPLQVVKLLALQLPLCFAFCLML